MEEKVMESPDGGKTIYERKTGKDKRIKIQDAKKNVYKGEKMKERIKELENEINEFQGEIQKKNNLIYQTQEEIQQLMQGILTRQGGIVELRKLVETEKMEIKNEFNSPTNM